ncbi:DedA family protein [Microlunatus speluncae]|uniref:DedA family protein n=1 Tax=Microlunatus speluncae TaxID=2594267 RepID=UPI0012661B50|nr:VTT domain-containing protein [Microlunatus speluncae]
METLTDFILGAAGSPWIYLLVVLVACIDGFFPPVPSESVVVALAAVGVATGQPWVIGVAVVAAIGAIAGDNIAFWMGRKLGVGRFAWMRRPKVAKVFDFARRQLQHRGALLILTARYIPVGRVAVNMTAGATGFSWKRFFPLSILAGTSWAVYSIAIGALAGHWVKDNPLLGAGIAIVAAMIIGFVIDKIVGRVTGRQVRFNEVEAESDVTESSSKGSPETRDAVPAIAKPLES